MGFTEKHENQLKQYLSIIVMVDNFNQSQDIAKEIGKLSTNIGVCKELVLEKHQTEHILIELTFQHSNLSLYTLDNRIR